MPGPDDGADTTMTTLTQLGPAATALVALVALLIGVATVRQKARSDRRDQWWKRAQWAIDHALDERSSNSRTAGLNALTMLGRSRLAGTEELELLDSLGIDELTGLAPADALAHDGMEAPEPEEGGGA